MKDRFPDSSMKSKIHDFIERHGGVVSSAALVRAFLKIPCDDEGTAKKIILPLLKGDARFHYRESAGWTISGKHVKRPSLFDQGFIIFAANIAESGRMKGRICEASFIRIKNKKEETSLHIEMPSHDPGKPPGISIKDAQQILQFVEDAVIAFFEPSSTYRQLQIEVGNKTGTIQGNETLSLRALMSSLFGLKRNVSLEEAAKALGIMAFHESSARIKAQGAGEVFLALLDHLLEVGIGSFPELKALEKKTGEPVDFSLFDFDRTYLETISEAPGIYKFLDSSDSPIYIGKAKNLRRRVSSYFLTFSERPAKIGSLYKSLKKIEYEETGSELEAILREAELIRSLKPLLNRQREVHERTARYGKGGSLIIILPATSDKEAVLYCIKDGKLIKSMRMKERGRDFKALKDLLKSHYFSRKRSSRAIKTKGRLDVDVELISSYLRDNRYTVNWFDPTDHKTPAEAIKVIRTYLQIPARAGERVICR